MNFHRVQQFLQILKRLVQNLVNYKRGRELTVDFHRVSKKPRISTGKSKKFVVSRQGRYGKNVIAFKLFHQMSLVSIENLF